MQRTKENGAVPSRRHFLCVPSQWHVCRKGRGSKDVQGPLLWGHKSIESAPGDGSLARRAGAEATLDTQDTQRQKAPAPA